MSEWIAFADRKPDSPQWIWLASPASSRDEPWWWEPDDGRFAQWTHWMSCPMPTTLPKKPKPPLPDGWDWDGRIARLSLSDNRHFTTRTTVQYRDDGNLWVVAYQRGTVCVPASVLDALKKVIE